MIYQKEYNSYDDYILRQGYKAHNRTKHILDGSEKRERQFDGLFKETKRYFKQGNVLCLGARDGSEVKCLRKLGFHKTMGIDLHPMNKIVFKGDWHDIPFDDGSFNNVFTNSIDHCYDLEKMLVEVKRVLVDEGVFFIHTDKDYNYKFVKKINDESVEQWMERHKNNALFWDDFDDLKMFILNNGFKLVTHYEKERKVIFITEIVKNELTKV